MSRVWLRTRTQRSVVGVCSTDSTHTQTNVFHVVQCSQDRTDCTLGKQTNHSISEQHSTGEPSPQVKTRLTTYIWRRTDIPLRTTMFTSRPERTDCLKDTTLNWNNYLWPEEMAYSGTYHAPTEQHRVPSLDSLTSIHTQTPLALIIHIKWPWQLCNSEFTHDLNSSVRTHRVSNRQLLFSYSELKKPLGWEVKHLQEMENKSSCLQYST